MRPALLPDAYGDKPYHLAEWEPFWEAANALKMPISMHVGGTRQPMAVLASFQPYKGIGFVGWYNQCVGMGETLGWLTFGGVFERYPDLHVIMTEGYAGWLAFAIQFFDHHWSDTRVRRDGPGYGRLWAGAPGGAAGLLPQAPGPCHLHVGSGCDPEPQHHGYRLLTVGQRLPTPRGVLS